MAKHILVTDDHAPTRELIRTVLESDRTDVYHVVECANGRDCLRAFERNGPFDLVLLDIGLPDMDGYSVCRKLREVSTAVPIVFVSAKGEIKDLGAGREAGGDSYLVKPFARNALRTTVNIFTSLERRPATASSAPRAPRPLPAR